MSRFNDLYRGEPDIAAERLDYWGREVQPYTTDELRLALVNALRRIAILERQVRHQADGEHEEIMEEIGVQP